MNGYVSYTEVQSVLVERLSKRKREPVVLNLGRRSWIRNLASAVLTFLF
jgi:hypothetical protein